jgi:NAD(P)-dependent dehydrogenase (short-subunit alcohol dehydrogenase family)
VTAARSAKTIFITGAGSGIGRATAKLFGERGWFVGLTDVTAEGLEETRRMLPEGSAWAGILDVRDRAAWGEAVSQFADITGGRLNGLFNNAGVGRHGFFEEVTDADNEWIIDVNVKGVINGVSACLPVLERTPGARIVNVASVAGIVGSPKLAVYSASKFAVRGLSEALDVELSRKGISVVCLMPYFVDTPILHMRTSDGSNHDMKVEIESAKMSVYPVELAAEKAWEAFHTERAHVIVGRDGDRARFMARFFPEALRKRLKRDVQAS